MPGGDQTGGEPVGIRAGGGKKDIETALILYAAQGGKFMADAAELALTDRIEGIEGIGGLFGDLIPQGIGGREPGFGYGGCRG